MSTEVKEKSDNELIAEFMGFSCCDTGQDRFWNPPTMPPATVDKWKFHSNHLDDFQTSWDWLMTVVEKINETIHPSLNEQIDVIIYRRTCHINDMQQIIIETTGKDMLDCTYKAVVEFIKWYNSQPK